MKKDSNLSNPASEPEHAAMEVTVGVHFDLYRGPVPKGKLQQWLASLPDSARVSFEGVHSGKAHFEAAWTEQR